MGAFINSKGGRFLSSRFACMVSYCDSFVASMPSFCKGQFGLLGRIVLDPVEMLQSWYLPNSNVLVESRLSRTVVVSFPLSVVKVICSARGSEEIGGC